MSDPAPAPSEFIEMKNRARRAMIEACEADAARSLTYRRLLVETITAAEGQPAAIRTQMFEQTALTLELLAFRKGWPGNLQKDR